MRTALLTAFCLAQASAFAAPYSIRVAELLPAQGAELQAKLVADGCYPVATEPKDGTAVVYFGVFDSYAESLWYLKNLQARGYSDARTVDIEGKPVVLTGPNRYVYASYFDRQGLASAAAQSYDPKDPRILPLYDQLKTDAPAAITELNRISADETSGPLRGWAMLRLGYAKIKAGDKDAALPFFKAVADGAVPATLSDRIEAANRAARLLIAKKQRVEALQALGELYELQTDPHHKAQTLTEMAGMKLELVRSAKGTFDEARAACKRVLDEAPLDAEHSRATAELMYMETYVFQSEPDFQKVVDLSTEFLKMYKGQRKLYGQGFYWHATSLRELGRDAEAEKAFKDIIALNLQPKEMFISANVMAASGLELSVMYRRLGRQTEALQWRDWVKSNYPDSQEAKMIDGYFHKDELEGR